MTADESLDAEVIAQVRDAALDRARSLGCSHAQVQVERIGSQALRLRDGRLESAADDVEVGVGVRVLHRGALGFAASVAVSPETAAVLADQAVDTATVTTLAGGRPTVLADEPIHADVD